jgi:hypothetical protein
MENLLSEKVSVLASRLVIGPRKPTNEVIKKEKPKDLAFINT